jgi:hypothetical protein
VQRWLQQLAVFVGPPAAEGTADPVHVTAAAAAKAVPLPPAVALHYGRVGYQPNGENMRAVRQLVDCRPELDWVPDAKGTLAIRPGYHKMLLIEAKRAGFVPPAAAAVMPAAAESSTARQPNS